MLYPKKSMTLTYFNLSSMLTEYFENKYGQKPNGGSSKEEKDNYYAAIVADINNMCEDKITTKEKAYRVSPRGWTIKAILHRLDKSGDGHAAGVLKFLAVQYYKKHGGRPGTTGGEGKQYEYHTDAAADYIVQAFKELSK